MDPTRLVNLSKSFSAIAKSNRQVIKKFQEKPIKGSNEYGQATAPKRGDAEQITGGDDAESGAKLAPEAMDSGAAARKPQHQGGGQRPRQLEESKQPDDAPTKWTEAQAFVPKEKAVMYKPKATQPTPEAAATAEAGATGAMPEVSA